jgi:hypothetical protein
VGDESGEFAAWSQPGVIPDGSPLEIVLQAAARFVGRIEPAPATRHILVHRRNGMRGRFRGMGEETVFRHIPTDGRGRFEIRWSPGDPIVLAFEPPVGAPIFFSEPPLAAGETRDLGTLRFAPGVSVAGIVLDDADEPVADCRLELEIRDVLRDRIVYAGPDGRFRFDGLPDAAAELLARAEGLLDKAIELPRAADLDGMEIRLATPGFVEGVLRDAAGRPVAGEGVSCVGEEYYGHTDSLGRFRIAAAPGTYRLECNGHEGPTVEVAARETARVEFRIE